MRKYIVMFVIGSLGGAFAIGVFAFAFHLNHKPLMKDINMSCVPARTASYQEAGRPGQSFPDFTVAAEKVMDAVVHIKSTQKVKNTIPQGQFPGFSDDFFQQFFGTPYGYQRQQEETQVGTGSGVIIKEDGYIITNNHVVENADEIEITLHDNRTFTAKVIGTDHSTDLALLKIDVGGLNFIPFANSDEVKVGQWVLAVGNPFNLNSTVTAGIVSAKGRNINIVKDKYAIESFIQTDAAINPGNSGGALVDMNGELVGINTAIASPTGSYSGYGFAIPSNIVKKVIGDLIEFGTVQRAFLGVSIRDVDAQLAKEKGLAVNEGVYVDGMQENSAARKAGVKAGDVIVSIDETRVKSTPGLQEVIASHKPGDVVKITVSRDNASIIIPVTLTTQTGKTELVKRDDTDIMAKLGITVDDAPVETIKKLGLQGGVKVTEIRPGIISKSTDMKAGCIIAKVDRQQVTSKDQFLDLMRNKQGGVLLECRYENQRVTYYYGFGL